MRLSIFWTLKVIRLIPTKRWYYAGFRFAGSVGLGRVLFIQNEGTIIGLLGVALLHPSVTGIQCSLKKQTEIRMLQ